MRWPEVKPEHYYGSELNRFIAECCTRKMTCINVDCLLVKNDQKKIRFIEYKHQNEFLPTSQLMALKVVQLITSQPLSGWNSKVFVVRGDYPFVEGAVICSINNLKAVKVNRENLIRWLNFEEELNLLEK